MIITEFDAAMVKTIPDQEERRALCPYVRAPFENCYCASTSSLFAEATIRFCGGNYKDCSIYLKHVQAEGGER